MKTYYNGFDNQEISFKAMSTLLTKRAVALQPSGEIHYAEAGGPFTGIITSLRNGLATVVTRGHAVASFKNTIPSVGICKLAVGASGTLEVDEQNGKPYTVLNVDIASKTIELIL